MSFHIKYSFGPKFNSPPYTITIPPLQSSWSTAPAECLARVQGRVTSRSVWVTQTYRRNAGSLGVGGEKCFLNMCAQTHRHTTSLPFSVLSWTLSVNVLWLRMQQCKDRYYNCRLSALNVLAWYCTQIWGCCRENKQSSNLFHLYFYYKDDCFLQIKFQTPWPSIIVCVDLNCQWILQVTVGTIFCLIVAEIH